MSDSPEKADAGSLDQDIPLPIHGFTGTPEEIERQWFEKIYTGRGDSMAQLTVRAVVMGSILGGVLSLTNLYVGLKAGWGLGVAITACILSYVFWNTLYRLGIAGSKMTILENNCMQSTASAAGYSTGGTLISAFTAQIMLTNTPLPLGLMLGWVFFLAVLGVTMAIPMKRQMINVEQLCFPSGVAAAETLRTLYSQGARAARSAWALAISAVLAAACKFWSEGFALIAKEAEKYSLDALLERANKAVLGETWCNRTVLFLWDPIFIAAGALTGLRVASSMLLGGTLCWVVFVPILQHQGLITEDAVYKDIVKWTLWGGVSCMVTSGIFSFALQWRAMVRALGSLGNMFSGGKREQNPLDAIETPMSWFFAGQLISLVALAWLAHRSFDMPYWESALAVAFSFLLALVACRVTGETDTTPIGPMGKVTQLIFGTIRAGAIDPVAAANTNLMAANITAGAAGSSADLLTDLKSGYLLGAHPRKQFLAQFAGIFIGTLVTVVTFRILVPNANAVGNEQFPAPAAQAWKAVAEAMSEGGLSKLEPVKQWSIIIGGLVGLILPLLSKLFPKYEKLIPSPAGIGLAWTFQWYYSLSFFLGAALAEGFARVRRDKAEELTYPIASGVIAGGSLMGVAIALWMSGPRALEELRKMIHLLLP